MTFISSINKANGSFMNYTAKKLSKNLEKGLKEPATFAAKMLVLSFVSKDAVNCILYTYQSYNNKKIPEDKRKFVAFLDLFNGIINVGGQIASLVLIERLLTPRLESIYTGALKYVNKDGKHAEKMVKTSAPLSDDTLYMHTENAIKENADLIKSKVKNVNIDSLLKDAKSVNNEIIKELGHSSSKGKQITTGLNIVISALATNALIKRTLAPLIATPLAGKFSENKGKKTAKPETKSETESAIESTPWNKIASDNSKKDAFNKVTTK